MSLCASGRVPDAEVLCVEYPGFVRDQERAIETLGGLASIARAKHDESALLQLRLRPADPHSHPIFGEKVAAVALLLRVRRPRTQPPSALGAAPPALAEPASAATATVVARVTQAVRFRGLADFQYLVRGQRTAREELDLAASVSASAAESDLDIPPTLFSPVDLVQEYASTWAGKRLLSTTDAQGKKRGEPKQSLYRIDFTLDQPIPQKPTALAPARASAIERHVLARLVALFDRRPVWTRLSLDKQLGGSEGEPAAPQSVVKAMLPYVAYYYLTGPWSRCYVKYGYDPRASPDSRIYQAVDIRLFKNSGAGAGGGGRGRKGAGAGRRGGLPGEVHAEPTALVPRKNETLQLAVPKRMRERANPKWQRQKERLSNSAGGAAGGGGAGEDGGEEAPHEEAAELVPRQRQLNYQLCEITSGPLLNAVHALPAPPSGSGGQLVCDPKSGWYSAPTLARFREQIKQGFIGQTIAGQGCAAQQNAAGVGADAVGAGAEAVATAEALVTGRKRRASSEGQPPREKQPRQSQAERLPAQRGAASSDDVATAFPLVLGTPLSPADGVSGGLGGGLGAGGAEVMGGLNVVDGVAVIDAVLCEPAPEPAPAGGGMRASIVPGAADAAVLAALRAGADGGSAVARRERALEQGGGSADAQDEGVDEEEDEEGEGEEDGGDDESDLEEDGSEEEPEEHAARRDMDSGGGSELQTFLQQHVPLARAQGSADGEMGFQLFGDDDEDDEDEDDD